MIMLSIIFSDLSLFKVFKQVGISVRCWARLDLEALSVWGVVKLSLQTGYELVHAFALTVVYSTGVSAMSTTRGQEQQE